MRKRKLKRAAAFLLALAVAIGLVQTDGMLLPAFAAQYAGGGEVSEAADEYGELIEDTVTFSDEDVSADNDELFAEYFESVLYEEVEDTSDDTVTAQENYGLTYFEKDSGAYNLYVYLKEQAATLAANGGSSSFTFTYSSAVSFTYESCESTSAGLAAFKADVSAVIKCLLVDCPAELYWYDKTADSSYSYYTPSYSANADGTYTYTVRMASIKMNVASDYQGTDSDGNTSSYIVDSTIATSAAAVVATAKSVVSEYSGDSDYEKLTAYRDWICDAVSYNYDAASYYEGGYGNPWQIIYVFDGDADTNVVCEGYSKAFQYLCDLSDFDKEIVCYTVSGTTSGNHMWNLVTMEDGKNYLCDITNCDNSKEQLWDRYFLAGTQVGSVEDGYTFYYAYAYSSGATSYAYSRGSLTYTYGDTATTLYSDEILTIASADYASGAAASSGDGEGTDISTAAVTLSYDSCTYTGSIRVPTVTVTLNGTVLTRGTDYTWFMLDNCYAGTATVLVTGAGDYTGTAVTSFTILPASLSEATVTLEETEYVYDGTAKTPSVTVTLGSTTLSEGVDFTVSYSDNTDIGTAAAVVTGMFNYTDSCTASFAIYEENHIYDDGVVVTEPTCTGTGLIRYTCTGCGYSYTETIAATGHSYDAGTVTAPTCTEDGYTTYTCTVCGSSYTADETEATGHSYEAVVTAPTCTEGGYTTYTCTVCGSSYTADETEATGHTYGLPSFTWADDCGSVTAAFTCSVCDDVQTVTTADVTGETTAATCTEAGLTTYSAVVTFEGIEHTATTSVVLEAIGHSYALTGFAWADDYSATATFTCANDETHTQTVEATVTSEVTTEATCTAEGVRTYTATAAYDDVTGTDTATESIEKIAHTYEAVVTEPTCTEGGYTTYICTVCGSSYTADETEATGHSYEAVVTAPTCTEGGYTTYTCSVCGDSYTADETAALGHRYVGVDTEPTCTEEGYTTYICSVCGDIDPDVIGIDMIPHSYEAAVTEPTCTEDGYTTYTCSVCGYSYIADETQAAGHSYEAAVTEPTCTEGGYTTYTCSICGDSYIADTTAATGHTEGDPVVTTTDTEITYTYYCTVCGELIRTETEAVPSDDSDKDNSGSKDNGDTTGTTPGSSYSVPATSIAAEKVDLTGATEAQVTQTLAKLTNDGDLAGSSYSLLQAKAAKAAKTSVKLQWKKVSGAKTYVVYANKCGKGNKLKKCKTVTGTSLNIKKIAGKKVTKGTYYKFLVVALDKNGEVIATSKTVHAATKGGKYTNQKSVTLYKGGKKVSKVTLKAGKSVKLKAKTTLQQKAKKFKQHRTVKYESSNTNIATVSSKGKIKAKKKGTCYIYAYAQNGISTKIKVTVK